VLPFSKVWPLLVGTLLMPLTFPAWAESPGNGNSQLTVSVYDDAGVPAAVLIQAEQKAARIFDRAGVNVIWANCPTSPNHVGPDALVRAGERSSPSFATAPSGLADDGLQAGGRMGTPAPTWSGLPDGGCSKFEWPTNLALRVVPRSTGSVNDVFGVAFLSAEGTGCYSNVYYDRAIGLHTDWNVGVADILGAVMAHELGHLLLGSNSHTPSGIMRGHWQSEELHRLVRGGLLFTPDQGQHMQGELSSVRPTLAATVPPNRPAK
jgi:hypothetical protein